MKVQSKVLPTPANNGEPESTVELSELYSGMSIKTENGVFHVCERDGGLEICFNGGRWYRWVSASGPEPIPFGDHLPKAEEPDGQNGG